MADHVAALPPDKVDQAVDDFAGPAHCGVHAPAAFQIGDQAVDRRRRKRIAADQQGMKAEHDAQLGVLHVFRDEAEDGTVAFKAQQVRRDPRHVGERAEWDVSQFFEPDPIDLLALLEEPFVTGDVVRRNAGHFGAHGVRIVGTGEHVAVVEDDSVKRPHRLEREVVGASSPAHLPKLVEQKRRGDDRRTGVEGVAVLPEDIGAAARSVELLKDGDTVAARAEPHGRGEPAEPRADDDGVGPSVGRSVAHVPHRTAKLRRTFVPGQADPRVTLLRP